MNKVADYDTYDYDYSTYWGKREYEHKAEVLVLNRLLKQEKGRWFLDIGGSFGRLTPSYYEKYTNPVIIDYSLKTLQKNYSKLIKDFPNIQLVAANAYFLPFKSSTFDGSLMVRVLHHIEKQDECIKEISRVLTNKGIHIQEYANKIHIKAVIRALISFNFGLFNTAPYQQPDKHNYEGTKEGSKVLFLNYHPRYISQLFHRSGLDIEAKFGCSFLRVNLLKRSFNINTLLLLESFFQKFISWANISPSIFVKAKINKGDEDIEKSKGIQEILVCPSCKRSLSFDGNKAKCSKCKKEYLRKENIWDFRI